jgi:ABC-type branched-subunit amino acid transport system ATPase component/ABC-type branched-subunit amino acid transport system permease subunit
MTLGSLVLGVLNGLAFGLLALGIVLVYKSHRFLNLAYAQLGAIPAVLLAKLVLEWGWGWWPAFVLCVAFGGGIGLLVDRVLVSPLRARTRSAVSLLLLSVGVGEILLALTYVPALGPSANKLAVAGYPTPFTSHVSIGSVVLGGQDILTLVLAPTLVLGLAAMLRYSSTGRQIRAAASNPDSARLCGVPVRRTSAIVWGLAGGFSAITAILQAPAQGTFNAAVLGPDLLLVALGGAAVGAFTSIPWALAGGLAIGLVQQITLGITRNGGTADVAVLVFIIGVVIVRGKAIGNAFSVTGSVVEDRAPNPTPPELVGTWVVTRGRKLLGAAALLVAVLLPLLPVVRTESHRFELSLILVYALLAVSLAVLIGWAGQVSLGQFAMVGVGAFVTARFASHGVSLLAVIVAAGAAGAVAMVIVGLPALRVPGLSLAVTTLGLAVIAPDWLFRQRWFGSEQPFGLRVAPRRVLVGLGRPASELGVYYLGLLLLVVAVAALLAVRRTTPGRTLLAVRDNEAAAASFGLTPSTIKLVGLAVSGFVAGTAGVVWAEAWRSVATTQFTPDLSMAALAAPVIGGVTSLGGSVAGAVLLYAGTYFLSPSLTSVFGSFGRQVGFQLAIGGIGVVVIVMKYPAGLAGAAQQQWERFLAYLVRAGAAPSEAAPTDPEVALAVDDVAISFGGIQALSGATVRVGKREIVGLIGPNGAGKSTLMNVISGTLSPSRGSVRVFGQELVGLAPEYRAGYGVARSFQDAALFPGLTVTEVVQVALDRRHRVGFLSSAVRAPWARTAEAESRAEARQIIDRLGLTDWADTLVEGLSTGTRRICDLAAQAAARPSVLLLDEPTAGVAQRDAEAFGPLLRRIRDELGCAVLVIEHDMPLLMALCDRVYALDSGRVIAEGTPAAIRSDPAVIASYLGTDPAAIDRSGGAARKRRARGPATKETV